MRGQGELSHITVEIYQGLEYLTEPRRALLTYLRAKQPKAITGDRIMSELGDRYGVSKFTMRFLSEARPEGSPSSAGPEAPLVELVDGDKDADRWRITKAGMAVEAELQHLMRRGS